jgi:pyruvate dehydrogenase E2 component (dihydrolipoamide acetyltransferase)
MARLMRMPEVAANATEAVLAEWLVGENVAFGAADAIATVETEKAVVDVEADEDGVVLKTLVAPGVQVAVGAPIAVLGEPGETVTDLDAVLAELGVVGGAPSVVPERRDVPGVPDAADPEGGTAATGPSAPAVLAPAQRPEDGRGRGSNGRVFASPLARKMARAASLPLEQVDGTGPRRRVLRRDVERALAGRTPAAAPDAAPDPRTDAYEEVPHSRIRRATAARLVESKTTAPHFYLRASLRVDRLLELRAELNEGLDVPVSLNDLIVKAVGAALVRVPEMNVTWTPDAVRQHRRVDLAVAVATERGLLTPVVRDVASKSIRTVSAETRDLAERARAGRLRQDELEGGSMSVTNLGMYGVEEFAAIINPPHASILAVGAVREEPVVEAGALVVGRVMRVTLSVDHRPVDGVVAARWMQAFAELVAHPARVLA